MDRPDLNLKSISIIFLFLCFLASVHNIMVIHALNEQILIGQYEVDVGSIIDVPILIINAESIAGGLIEINFNNSVTIVETIIEGDFGQPVAYINNTEGVIGIAVACATAVNKQNATMAIIKFKGVKQGYTDLIINNAELNDEEGNLIYPSYTHGNINIIPEFTSILVLTMGLLMISLIVLMQKQRLKLK